MPSTHVPSTVLADHPVLTAARKSCYARRPFTLKPNDVDKTRRMCAGEDPVAPSRSPLAVAGFIQNPAIYFLCGIWLHRPWKCCQELQRAQISSPAAAMAMLKSSFTGAQCAGARAARSSRSRVASRVVCAAARPTWLPNLTPPAHLDGNLAGDFGAIKLLYLPHSHSVQAAKGACS